MGNGKPVNSSNLGIISVLNWQFLLLISEPADLKIEKQEIVPHCATLVIEEKKQYDKQ